MDNMGNITCCISGNTNYYHNIYSKENSVYDTIVDILVNIIKKNSKNRF